jgi:hypothetical protein
VSRSSKIVIAVLAVVLVLVLCCVCGTLGYFGMSADEAAIDHERSATEGAELGRTADEAVCLDQAVARAEACGALGFMCQNAVDEFVRSCLRSVPSPDPHFCDGVPQGTFLSPDVASYLEGFCGARGHGPGSACEVVPQSIVDYCAARPSSPIAPAIDHPRGESGSSPTDRPSLR